jgi:hypothetical protein
MKVKTLINRLLNYDMNIDVELVIHGEDEERYTCTLPDDSIDGHGGLDYCPIIFILMSLEMMKKMSLYKI